MDKPTLIAALDGGNYLATGPYGAIADWDVSNVDNFDQLVRV